MGKQEKTPIKRYTTHKSHKTTESDLEDIIRDLGAVDVERTPMVRSKQVTGEQLERIRTILANAERDALPKGGANTRKKGRNNKNKSKRRKHASRRRHRSH